MKTKHNMHILDCRANITNSYILDYQKKDLSIPVTSNESVQHIGILYPLGLAKIPSDDSG
jgi:hypothetical protein